MSKRDSKSLQPHSLHTSSLNNKAEEDLRFIRETMEGASAFTSVSGLGLLAAGLTGLTVVGINRTLSDAVLVSLWLSALIVAGVVSTTLTIVKARRQGTSLWSASGKKLLYAFCPTMFVGGVITFSLTASGMADLLPGFWLCLYGAAVMTAGAHSVTAIKILGAGFILLGIITFAQPAWAWSMLTLGFGGLHLIAAYHVWRYHGG